MHYILFNYSTSMCRFHDVLSVTGIQIMKNIFLLVQKTQFIELYLYRRKYIVNMEDLF